MTIGDGIAIASMAVSVFGLMGWYMYLAHCASFGVCAGHGSRKRREKESPDGTS